MGVLETIISVILMVVAVATITGTINYNFHKKVDQVSTDINTKIDQVAKDADAARGRVYTRLDEYKRHNEDHQLPKKVDMAYCTLKHDHLKETLDRVEETLRRVEGKLDKQSEEKDI